MAGLQQQQSKPPLQQSMSNPTQMTPTMATMSSGNVLVARVPQNPSIVETYLSRQSMGVGITLVVIGVLTPIFNGVGFAINNDLFAILAKLGFVDGVLFIIAGSLGIAAANKKRWLIITFMVMSIISVPISIVLLLLGIILITISSLQYNLNAAAVAMTSLMVINAIVGAVMSIWGFATGCHAFRCGAPQYSSVVAPLYGNQQEMIIIQQQQQQPGTDQEASSQMMPTTISSSAYPQSGYPPPQQYSADGNSTQQPQQDNSPDVAQIPVEHHQ